MRSRLEAVTEVESEERKWGRRRREGGGRARETAEREGEEEGGREMNDANLLRERVYMGAPG